METDIAVGKYAVAVVNKDRAVGHLMKEKTGKFAKIVFFFLRAEVSNMVTVKINRKAFSNAYALISQNSALKFEILRVFIQRDPKNVQKIEEFEKLKFEKYKAKPRT